MPRLYYSEKYIGFEAVDVDKLAYGRLDLTTIKGG